MPTLVYPTVPIQHGDLDKRVQRDLPEGRCLSVQPMPGLKSLSFEEERDWVMAWYNETVDEKTRAELYRALCLGTIIDEGVA